MTSENRAISRTTRWSHPEAFEVWLSSESRELRPDERIPFAATLKGALGRFLPAGVLLAFAVMAASQELGLSALVATLFFEVPLTSGYIAGIELLRRRLRGDAGIDGRKSVIAGAVAPLVLFAVVVGLEGARPLGFLLWTFLSGFVTAVLLFFPWLRTASSDEAEPEDDSAPMMIDWDRP
jgi:hypothetical protein